MLVAGFLLIPGRRMAAAALRVVGLDQDPCFDNYQRVLNRARWASLALSPILLRLLLAAFVPAEAPVVVGIDEHIERRRGPRSRPRESIATQFAPARSSS